MTTVVFVGPTLSAAEVGEFIDAKVLPPVAQGDVYRVAQEKPHAIGIIDGYFDGVPSVWHKEILWAIEQGITVFGSASMGALRAAELDAFGMIGVGEIFEAYLSGDISDDDEVAVLHGPAELGYAPLSEPMVSIRATVKQAQTAGIVTTSTAASLIDTAKSIHYRDRTWPEILARLEKGAQLAGFVTWLPDGRVDAKREDARAMLGRMSSFLSGEEASKLARRERVERTLIWQGLVRRTNAEPAAMSTEVDNVLDELRLDPDRFLHLRDKAALRCFALEEAARRGLQPERGTLLSHMERHRSRENLSRRDTILQWLHDNDLDEKGYETLIGDAASLDETLATLSKRLTPHLVAELQWAGDYAALKKRADEKASVVGNKSDQDHVGASPERLQLLIWYFENHLERPVPDDLDLYAKFVGLADREELFRLIEDEFLYCQDRRNQRGNG